MFPPILHAHPGAFVRLITPRNHFFQMVIFRFYNLISRISMEWGITWSTHLFTCHCLHLYQLLLVGFSGGTSSSHLERDVDVDVAQVVRRRDADLQRAGGRPHRLLEGGPVVEMAAGDDAAGPQPLEGADCSRARRAGRIRSWQRATCSAGDCVSHLSMAVMLAAARGRCFSIHDRFGHLFRHARRDPRPRAHLVAPVVLGGIPTKSLRRVMKVPVGVKAPAIMLLAFVPMLLIAIALAVAQRPQGTPRKVKGLTLTLCWVGTGAPP